MKQLFEALTALLKVKTIVTLVIIVVLAVLSLNGSRTSFSPSQQWSLRSILERRMKKSRSFPP